MVKLQHIEKFSKRWKAEWLFGFTAKEKQPTSNDIKKSLYDQ